MKRALLVVVVLAGCNLYEHEDPVPCFCGPLSLGNPGAPLPEGGEARVEHVFVADGTHQENPDGTGGLSWMQAYQWTSTDLSTTKSLPPEGTCTDLRTGQFWPTSLINSPSITDIDEGSAVTITGPTGATVLPKCTTATNDGEQCSTLIEPRVVDLMYGGPDAGNPPGTFLSDLDPDAVQQNSDYAVDLDGKMTDEGGPISIHVPSRYDAPLGIGTASVAVPANADFNLTWTPPDDPSTGENHTGKTDFGRFYVIDTNASSNQGYPLSWVCIPAQDPSTGLEIDGSITVPATVVNQWPKTGGLLVHDETTHYMEAIGDHRFDLIGTWSHISPFTVE